MNLAKLIENSLNKIEEERKITAENSGWFVQYVPCGHFRELNPSETELVERAKNRKNIDALILSSEHCPECYTSIELGGWAIW